MRAPPLDVSAERLGTRQRVLVGEAYADMAHLVDRLLAGVHGRVVQTAPLSRSLFPAAGETPRSSHTNRPLIRIAIVRRSSNAPKMLSGRPP